MINWIKTSERLPPAPLCSRSGLGCCFIVKNDPETIRYGNFIDPDQQFYCSDASDYYSVDKVSHWMIPELPED